MQVCLSHVFKANAKHNRNQLSGARNEAILGWLSIGAYCVCPARARSNGILYKIQEQYIKDVYFKSTSRGQGQAGDCLSEGSRSANLRAYAKVVPVLITSVAAC